MYTGSIQKCAWQIVNPPKACTFIIALSSYKSGDFLLPADKQHSISVKFESPSPDVLLSWDWDAISGPGTIPQRQKNGWRLPGLANWQ